MGLKNLEEVKGLLANPDKAYRSVPFWGWNAKLEKEELIRQMSEMKEQKMGGFFIHSREGLETEYLSEEWMNLVKDTVEYAKKENLEAWIYDEDKWPSGSAGGMVSAKNPKKFTAKGLTLEVLPGKNTANPALKKDSDILGIFYQDRKTLVFRQEISMASEWYNGMAPTDNLNKEAVREFLDMTHEKYKEVCGEEFGKTVKGIFTDEPNFCDFFSIFTKGRPWLPWGEGFEQEFQTRRGYNILERLPGLFFDCEGCEKVRHDYWWTLTEVFGENYMKQIFEWCCDNHLMMTGHVLYENDLGYGVRVSGGAMPHYRYMHAPGIDILGEQAQEYLTVKQCTSVANQYGRDMVVSETYGCTGWGLTFEGQKWLGDWQYVLGVTRRCQHLALYSITGCRKRDYPPVFNYQNSWWKEIHVLEDYFARISVCTTAGKAVRDVLVIHPLTTMWTKSRCAPWEDLSHVEMNMGWLDEHLFGLNREGERYNRLAAALMGMHYDFDFGDEIILGEEACINAGKFQVREASYSTIIVPPVTTLLSSTVDKLEKFLQAGGNVLWIGSMISMIEGRSSRKAGILRNYEGFCQVEDEESAYRMLEKIQPRSISIKDSCGREASDILAQIRALEDSYVVFLINHNRSCSLDIKVSMPCYATVSGCNLLSGKWEQIAFHTNHSQTDFQLHFSPSESKMIFLKKTGEIETSGEKEKAENIEKTEVIDKTQRLQKIQEDELEFPYLHPHRADVLWCTLGPEAEVALDMENALILDTCKVFLDAGWPADTSRIEYVGQIMDMDQNIEISQVMDTNRIADITQAVEAVESIPVWKAQEIIRKVLDMQPIYYNGAPQRYTWIQKPCSIAGHAFTMEFEVEVLEVPEGEVYLAVENPKSLKVFCNGTACPKTNLYFLDRGILKYRIQKLKKGINKILLSGIYTNEMELEDIYLTGDFGVDYKRRITKKVTSLHFGDWCMQGLFHYAGGVSYQFPIKQELPAKGKILLRPVEYKGALVNVQVNGKEAGILIGKSNGDLDITKYLNKNENQITLSVAGSLRNLLGPFHQTYTGCSRISWEDFRTEGKNYSPEYVVEPYGIMGQIVLAIVEGD